MQLDTVSLSIIGLVSTIKQNTKNGATLQDIVLGLPKNDEGYPLLDYPKVVPILEKLRHSNVLTVEHGSNRWSPTQLSTKVSLQVEELALQ
jgi:hypothetical protein